MPFPTAHPAAVLPLRRYCPRYTDFAALVIGSLIPDAAYALGGTHLAVFSHQWLGSFGFCLPLGWLAYLLVAGARSPLARRWPLAGRWLIGSSSVGPRRSWWIISASLLIGSWTHQFLDALTHKNGWLVQHVPLLSVSLLETGGHAFKLYQVLWYACTFVGTAWVGAVYLGWLHRAAGPSRSRLGSLGRRLRYALLLALLVLVCAVAHKRAQPPWGTYAVSACTLLLVLGFALEMARGVLRPGARPSP